MTAYGPVQCNQVVQGSLAGEALTNITASNVSVLLLMRLRLQQLTLHQFTKFLPTLYLILRSLYGVQTVQVVYRHTQWLSKCNMHW